MKIFSLKNISQKKLRGLFSRPAIESKKVFEIVKPIIADVKKNGLKAALKYAKKYDCFDGADITVSKKEIEQAEKLLDRESKKAILTAFKNIEKFHTQQYPKSYSIETMPGINCSREFRAIENVGLYIPGGTAVLPSTMLMLG
ncbi:MAG: histidinol dehydrogenase, partial [Ignavibacteriales bacterium]|nr:histidinol dehydrogenase [Ignavibacteriales bacterium]